MALLRCENLAIGYGAKVIQADLNFQVEEGEYFVIIGENGAGKSTLMKTILGFQKPMSGKVHFSKDLGKAAVGYLPQQNSSLKDFPASVQEIVLSGRQGNLGLFPFYKKEDRKIAQAQMEKLGILGFRNKSFHELSGGQQQRVLLARALCAAKKLLVLDEPVKGFDPAITKAMYDDIADLNKNGMTVIMISHDINASEKYASKILELRARRQCLR